MKVQIVLGYAIILQLTRAAPQAERPLDKRRFGVGEEVNTSSGKVTGQAAANLTEVSEYLGIPFAQAPIGDLRFAAPQPFTGSGKINATSYSGDCPCTPYTVPSSGLASPEAYRLLAQRAQTGNTFNEDCLTLNIWTKPQVGEKRKAVLLYIHGGGFQTGTPNDPSLNGQYFAEKQDVVVVSINYRLAVFGFTGLPGMPQNVGLLDQRMAVEWVHKNIDKFGGDPQRITLFGQSAGSASVDIYSFAWTDKPLVHGFIEESGTATSFFDPAPLNNTAHWFNATEKLGCGDATAGIDATLACMRTKTYQDILNATQSTGLEAELGMFGPTIDNLTIFGDYAQRAESGRYIQKPYVIGNNDYESGLFKVITKDAGADISDLAWAIADLAAFSCPASAAAVPRSSRVPTYRYRYYGDFSNTRLTIDPNSGGWHGAEIPTIWQTAPLASEQANTPAEETISSYLNGAWASFAKDPHSALSKGPYNWPQYSQTANTLIRFAYNNETVPSYISPATYDAPCEILRKILASLENPFLTLLSANQTELAKLLAPLDQFTNLTAMGGGSEVGY